MSILLDTHVLLAIINGEEDAVADAARAELDADESRVVVSVASLWEATIKWRLGKLPLPARPETLPELIKDIGFEILPIRAEHAVSPITPDPPTRDPFDRLLPAQCKVEGLKLLTSDRALASHPLALKLN